MGLVRCHTSKPPLRPAMFLKPSGCAVSTWLPVSGESASAPLVPASASASAASEGHGVDCSTHTPDTLIHICSTKPPPTLVNLIAPWPSSPTPLSGDPGG